MDALKLLSELDFQARYEDKPGYPIHARIRKMFSDRTANGLTNCIITFLKLTGSHAERINTMGRPIDRTTVTTNCLGQRQRIGSIDWLPGSGQRGSADISATIKGRSVKIEVKINDRQSKAQREYQKQIENAGGLYWLVRSFDQFYMLYHKLIKG
jgi:hypothetical protein